MATLTLLRSKPESDRNQKMVDAFADGKVIKLYEGNIDWANVVDEIFAHDRVISWW